MGNGGCRVKNKHQQHLHKSVWDRQTDQSHNFSSPFLLCYRPPQWTWSGTRGRPGSWRKTFDLQTSSISPPAVDPEAPSAASRDGSERRQEDTDVWVCKNNTSSSDRAYKTRTHRNVAAVDQDLHDWVFFVRVHRGKVIQGAVDRPVDPLSEFTGQMFGVTLVELPLKDVRKKLQTNRRKTETKDFCRGSFRYYTTAKWIPVIY